MEPLIDNRREVKLAEGVTVFLSPAGVTARLYAKSIDLIIQGVFLGIVATATFTIFSSFGLYNVAFGTVMLASFLVYWFYDVLFEQLEGSASPGKRLLKLQVLTLAGAPPSLFHSLTRAFLLPIDSLPVGLLGLSAVMASRYSQRIGDLCAGTVVTYREKVSHRTPQTAAGSAESKVEEESGKSVRAVPPPAQLARKEQLAFLRFSQQYPQLSQERREEIVSHLPLPKGAGKEESAVGYNVSYALGIARWIEQKED